jgi:outer membrane murein-binding lipoprotein Lpp
MLGRAGVGCRSLGAVLLVVGVLGGCGGSGSSQPSNSEIDRVNHRVSDLNAAYERMRVGANACHPGDSPEVIASCFDRAFAQSGIDSVLSSFDREVRGIAGRLDAGECRAAMQHFDATLVALRRAVATMKHDADIGQVGSLFTDGHAVQDAWKLSVRAEAETDKPC